MISLLGKLRSVYCRTMPLMCHLCIGDDAWENLAELNGLGLIFHGCSFRFSNLTFHVNFEHVMQPDGTKCSGGERILNMSCHRMA